MLVAGTWNLVACTNTNSSGDVEHHYGLKPFGRLHYDSSGHMSVFLSRPDRPHFQSSDRDEARDEEYLAACVGFDAYCGSYRLDPSTGTVFHFIEGSFFPNWIGTTVERYYTLSGPHLELRTPPIFWRGDTWVFKLLWQRAEKAPL